MNAVEILRFDYIEIREINGRNVVLVGMPATPENVEAVKRFLGENIHVELLAV